MQPMTVPDLADLYGITKQSVYKRIRKGQLSKGADGRVDLAEAIRVLGEPSERVNQGKQTGLPKFTQVDSLEQKVTILENLIAEYKERELYQRKEMEAKNDQLKVKDNQIESLQRLLGLPKQESNPVEVTRVNQTQEKTPEPPPPIAQEEVAQEVKPKKGLLKRATHIILGRIIN